MRRGLTKSLQTALGDALIGLAEGHKAEMVIAREAFDGVSSIACMTVL